MIFSNGSSSTHARPLGDSPDHSCPPGDPPDHFCPPGDSPGESIPASASATNPPPLSPHAPASSREPRPPLLEITGLRVSFATHGGAVQAVRGVDLNVEAGETLALVGESGCGKSAAMLAVMGLIPTPPGRIDGGAARLRGASILGLPEAAANRLRGARLGMIFQDPISALNPTMTIGDQVAEPLRIHRKLNRAAARREAARLLHETGLPDAEARLASYPHQFSGGMRQRVMIALALAADPEILIADEPTTALDVTIQAQILALLQREQARRGMALILITHDLGVVARLADRVAVMYAGQIVERAGAAALFAAPAHPYTLGLLRAAPSATPGKRLPLTPIPGAPPDLLAPPPGCAFAPRCPNAMRICVERDPGLAPIDAGRLCRCWLHHPQRGDANPIPGLWLQEGPG